MSLLGGTLRTGDALRAAVAALAAAAAAAAAATAAVAASAVSRDWRSRLNRFILRRSTARSLLSLTNASFWSGPSPGPEALDSSAALRELQCVLKLISLRGCSAAVAAGRSSEMCSVDSSAGRVRSVVVVLSAADVFACGPFWADRPRRA
eukprot:1926686-Pleurochrysis_carterae.AAC.4